LAKCIDFGYGPPKGSSGRFSGSFRASKQTKKQQKKKEDRWKIRSHGKTPYKEGSLNQKFRIVLIFNAFIFSELH